MLKKPFCFLCPVESAPFLYDDALKKKMITVKALEAFYNVHLSRSIIIF